MLQIGAWYPAGSLPLLGRRISQYQLLTQLSAQQTFALVVYDLHQDFEAEVPAYSSMRLARTTKVLAKHVLKYQRTVGV